MQTSFLSNRNRKKLHFPSQNSKNPYILRHYLYILYNPYNFMVNIKKSVQSKHFGHPVNFKNYSLTLGVREHRRLHPRYSSSLQNLKYKTIFINKLILKLKRNLFNVFNTTAAKFSYSKEGVPRIMTVARRHESRLRTLNLFETSAQDPDPLDPQDFGFLDPDPQKCADPRIQVQGVKYQPKTAEKTFLLLKPKIALLKKRENTKISPFLNGSSRFRLPGSGSGSKR